MVAGESTSVIAQCLYPPKRRGEREVEEMESVYLVGSFGHFPIIPRVLREQSRRISTDVNVVMMRVRGVVRANPSTMELAYGHRQRGSCRPRRCHERPEPGPRPHADADNPATRGRAGTDNTCVARRLEIRGVGTARCGWWIPITEPRLCLCSYSELMTRNQERAPGDVRTQP
jgi:hypothetical protein